MNCEELRGDIEKLRGEIQRLEEGMERYNSENIEEQISGGEVEAILGEVEGERDGILEKYLGDFYEKK